MHAENNFYTCIEILIRLMEELHAHFVVCLQEK